MRIAPLVLILIALCLPAAAQEPAQGPPIVVTNGTGVIKRAPDRAWVTIAAESRAKTPQEAQKQNAAAMSAVIGKLKGAGLPADAIQTSGYDLQPDYEFNDGRQTIRGYIARNTVEVRVDTLPKLGEFIEMAVTSGATTIRGVRFDLQDRAGVEREALRLAVADARRRAEAAAAGADMKVVGVIRILEGGAEPPPMPRPVMMQRAEMAASAAPPIEAGELEIRATVTLTAVVK